MDSVTAAEAHTCLRELCCSGRARGVAAQIHHGLDPDAVGVQIERGFIPIVVCGQHDCRLHGPVTGFVELMESRRLCSPKKRLMARVSTTSLAGVAVPWALM